MALTSGLIGAHILLCFHMRLQQVEDVVGQL